jgi:3',5'-cyclic AMP phosphodiesterase CpdA
MPVHDLLKKHGVKAVFHGHDHSYAYQEYDGIVYQLCPQPREGKPGDEPEALSHGYASGTILAGPGHLKVTVTKKLVTVELVYASEDEKNGGILHQWQVGK